MRIGVGLAVFMMDSVVSDPFKNGILKGKKILLEKIKVSSVIMSDKINIKRKLQQSEISYLLQSYRCAKLLD